MIQLPLPLERGGLDDGAAFVLGAPNAAAVEVLLQPESWAGHCCVLVGSPRSGRSRLAALFSARNGAVVFDDAETLNETELFLGWNNALAAQRPMLVVTRSVPALWPVSLPDLASRLNAALIARIEDPDEALIRDVLAQELAQRGVAYSQDLPEYLALRISRDYAVLDSVIKALDHASASAQRSVSVASARAILIEIGLLQE